MLWDPLRTKSVVTLLALNVAAASGARDTPEVWRTPVLFGYVESGAARKVYVVVVAVRVFCVLGNVY